ncbi:biliverdin-producing heme oxygenase [Rhodococcus sp. D2-41]|uniref:Biliverdin-producing heme oxygenase n=1 Tax=Speluncibacter jeojiensis TaxID=2710754 RepID=A0A9X4M097_9ACTN|nr:biliverdin-producing heme oxygenase [Rhodococcus sp. D2-41]MDG3009711.1 biliverdin-producing heme oxygenase [Rhodococcus sp. D2-41]MDG3014459.1 biliverdin-producing heme oxygenase [Corynebacteriales bacterium D3-21]
MSAHAVRRRPDTLFTDRLRNATAESHKNAEESSFVGELLSGALNESAYADMLGQNYLIYEALERRAAQLESSDPVRRFHSAALVRTAALEADLEFLTGPEWRSAVKELPATTRYVERIEKAADEDPLLFVAHHYIRYLGDLSGGQIIRRAIGNAYGHTEDGVRFYIFDEIPKPKPFKDDYRDALDGLELSPADEQRFIAEVNDIFGLNRDVFDDLAAGLDGYRVRS